jgi:cytochrome c553
MNIFFVLLTLLLTLSPPILKADIQGKIIAYNCYSCHGDQLTTLYPTQILSNTQLTKMLLAFKYDKKKSTIMNRITKGYSDRELKSVATYLRKVN